MTSAPSFSIPGLSALSDDEARALAESVRRVRAAAECQLREGATPRRLVAELHRGVDRVAARASERGVPIACTPGCDHCCHARVEVLPDEAACLAQILRHWPDEARRAAVARLQAQASARRAAPLARHACALLIEHRCSVYAQRPAACRKAHSLDANACASGAASLPQDLALVLDAQALMRGVGQALAAPALELAASLLAQLPTENLP